MIKTALFAGGNHFLMSGDSSMAGYEAASRSEEEQEVGDGAATSLSFYFFDRFLKCQQLNRGERGGRRR